jgi:16S rRNA (cytidine1402-2'-O)-methyltransferase
MPGTLFVVATPIGNLEDVTARALRVLREVTLIAAEDTRRTAHLLARYAITTPTTSLHEHNESKKAASLVARLAAGDSIALVSDAGTPTLSDPGRRLVQDAIEAGIRVEAIPGASAIATVLAASGLPSDTFTFLGFPPTRSKDRSKWLEDLRTAGRTVVFFEAPHRIRETLEQLRALLGNLHIVVGRELTKAHEELVRGPISDVLERITEPRGEFTVAVDIGQIPYIREIEPVSDGDVFLEFGEITNKQGLTRRAAVKTIARRHQRPANEVYEAIEKAKKLAQ